MKKSRYYIDILFLVLQLIIAQSAFSATYYMGTAGNDSNSCATAQSSTTPKRSFSSAWGCLVSGDTLTVGDGTYTNASPPPDKSGTSGNTIKIKAANDGGVTISDGILLTGNAYLEFEGFKLSSSEYPLQVVSNGTGKPSHHVTFRRTGFTTTTAAEYGGTSFSDGTHHMLLEDFWMWGGGRYTFSCYGGSGGNPPNTTCDYNTFRRGIIRQGPATSSPGNPQAGFTLYAASNNTVENVIVLDSAPVGDSSKAAFYLTTHECCVSNNSYYGVIALNNNATGWQVDHNATGNANRLINSVIWNNNPSNISVYTSGTCNDHVIDHVTSGVTGTWETFVNFCNRTTVKSSIFTRAKTYGMANNSGSIAAADYNLLYGNTSGNYNNVNPGAHDKTTNPQLLYIVRTEPGTPCKGAGEGGTDCGATVVNRYQDGVLTATSLWPWPNEARIKKDMCTDAGVTSGFCGDTSLTNYIMNYLGNGNPYGGVTTYTVTSSGVNTTGTGTITPASRTGISSGQTTTFDVSPSAGSTATMSSTCGTGSPASGTSNFTYTTAAITANCAVTATFSDVTPPVITNPIPSGVQASGTTQVTLGVTTELPATCKYGASGGSDANTTYAALPNTFSTTGGTTHRQLTSVTGGSSYTFYVRCQDPAGNTNLTSSTINFSVASGDTTPPTISNITSTTADGSYKAGSVIDVRVTFSEAVTSTGPVTVTLETGTTDRTCTFTITNATLGVCSPGYTVASPDTSADLNVNTVSGTINDQASPPNPMVNFSIPSNLAANKNIVIDTTAPSNQNTVFAASQTVTASASVNIVSAGEIGGAVWFAPSGTTTFTAGPTMTTASGTATTLQAPSTRGAYRLFVIDLAGNVSTQSTAILTVAWTVTPSVSGGNGTIAPSVPVLVANGATTQFTLSPSTGYTGSASGCGGSLVGLTYTTAAISANCTVIASFADTQAPTVSVTAPTAGQVVTGTSVPVTATASDNSGTVASVQFKLDTVPIGSLDTSSPFGIVWNTTTASEGAHTLTATAIDPTGNPITSAGVAITVDNEAPALSLLGPSGAQAKTTATIPLVVTTNELAICRFAPSCVTEFGSMELFFSQTFEWDPYIVSPENNNIGANYFIIETRVDNREWVRTPNIMPITTTTYTVDLSGRSGSNITAHMKACRPGSYSDPPQTPDECSVWSNEVTTGMSTPILSLQVSHMRTLPVSAGASYRYCIKCQDISGNTSPGTYIYFSIDAKPKQDLLN